MSSEHNIKENRGLQLSNFHRSWGKSDTYSKGLKWHKSNIF